MCQTRWRIVGRRLQERFGQTVVVENRPGANGGIAVNRMIGSPADGQTFLVTDGAILSINPQVYGKLPYDPKDVAAVAYLAQAPLFLAIHPKVPVDTIKKFIEYIRARPGQLNYGSSGVGSTHHISMEALKSAFKLNITHVPFKGAGESGGLVSSPPLFTPHDHADFVLQGPAERCSVETRDARRAELLLRRCQWNRIGRLCKRNSPTAPP